MTRETDRTDEPAFARPPAAGTAPVVHPTTFAPARRRRTPWIPLVLALGVAAGLVWWDGPERIAGALTVEEPAFTVPPLAELSAVAPADGYPLFGGDDLVRHLESEMIAQRGRIDVTAWARTEDGMEAVRDAAYEAVSQSPYVFVDRWTTYSIPGRTEVRPVYEYSAEEAERRRAVTVSAVTRALDDAGVTGDLDDATAAARIYDYIAAVAEYDWDAFEAIAREESSALVARSQEAYGILVDGTAVCGGYSMAFQAMAHAAGLDVVTVSGSDSAGATGASHAWNKVRVDGRWRLVDITWDDDGATAGRDYFLLADSDRRLDSRVPGTDWMTDARIADFAG